MTDYNKTRARLEQFYVARDFAKNAWSRYKIYKQTRENASRYFVAVEEEDDLYDKVLALLTETIPPEDRRSLLCVSESTWDEEKSTNVYTLSVLYDNKFSTHIELGGYRIKVTVTNEKSGGQNGVVDTPSLVKSMMGAATDTVSAPMSTGADVAAQIMGAMSKMDSSYAATSSNKRVIFQCESVDAREAIITKLTEMTEEFNAVRRQSRFYVAGMHGWHRRNTMMERPLDSVVLPDGDLTSLVEDIQNFMSSEQWYVERGLPWHRGYLLHGPPGTGKSSVASALAGYFHRDVYFMALSTVSDDNRLQELFNSISTEGSILVIEDIDIAHASRERDDKGKGITLQGLLNCLDGMGTPHGLILITTTNMRQNLNSALIRPGRVDFELEVGYITNDQLQGLLTRFHGSTVDVPPVTGKITPAEVVGLFKDGLDDADLQVALIDLIERRNGGEEPPEEQPHTPVPSTSQWANDSGAPVSDSISAAKLSVSKKKRRK